MDFIERMPKIDLHNHLDGGLRPRTVIEIARDEGIELPTYDEKELMKYLSVGDNCESLVEYLEKFDLPLKCLQSEKAQRRVAKEAVEDAAKHNVKYIEVRFAPQLMTEKGMTCADVIRNVISGLLEGERETGTIARAIVCCMRHHSDEKNLEVIRAASEFMYRGLGGVDLAGDEAHYPPQLFKRVFDEAYKYGIPVTIHAGEAGGAENVRVAIEELGAVRIGHGIRINEDDSVVNLVKERGIPLEICVTSNVQTKAAPSFEQHPVRKYFDLGLNVTVNTDNTTVSNTDMTRELNILKNKFEFSNSELMQLQMNAARATFLDKPEKEKLLSELKNSFENII